MLDFDYVEFFLALLNFLKVMIILKLWRATKLWNPDLESY